MKTFRDLGRTVHLTEVDGLHHLVLSTGQGLVVALDLLLTEISNLQGEIDHAACQAQGYNKKGDKEAQLHGKAIVRGGTRVSGVTSASVPTLVTEAVRLTRVLIIRAMTVRIAKTVASHGAFLNQQNGHHYLYRMNNRVSTNLP